MSNRSNTQTGSGGSTTSGAGGSTGRGGSSSTGTGGTITPTGCIGQCTDFEPTASNPNPMFDQGVSSDVGSKFGNAQRQPVRV